MKFTKSIARIINLAGIGGLIAVFGLYTAIKPSYVLPTMAELQETDNISAFVGEKEQKAIKISRQSAVQVISTSHSGKVAKLSGTYITHKEKYYVLTALHGIVGVCENVWIWTADGGYSECVSILAIDKKSDYALMEINKLPDLIPVSIPRNMPRISEWKQSLSIQTEVFYTGFPNSSNLLTIGGEIIGYSDRDKIYINSYAWSGSSGSGVFNKNGKLIGYIVAIDVGETEYGVEVLSQVVYVEPAFKVDWSSLF